MFEDQFNGVIYKSEDEARKVAREQMVLADYLEYGAFFVGKLLKLVLEHCPEEVADEIREAEEIYFINRFYEVEEDE